MSVVSRRIYFVIFASLLSVLSACSDSGSGTSATVDSRLKNFDTPYAIDEGLEGVNSTLDITFTSTVTGTLSYASFNVSAAAKSDYTAVSGQLEVVEGNEYTVSVTVFGDSEIEGNEKFGLTLSFDGEELETYYGLIINDDLPGISISTTSVLEGDSGTSLLPFTFTLEEEVVDPYTFQLSTPVVDAAENNAEAGTFYAIPGVDFEAVDQTITFEAGQTDITINVVVNADNVLELDELVYLQLNSNTSATGTIITDDSVDDQGFDLYSTNDSGAQDEGSPSAASPDEVFWQKVVYPITVENPGNIIDSQTVQISLQKGTSNISWADPGLDQDYCANNPEESEGQAVCETVNSYTLEHGTATFDVEFYVRADSDVEDSEEIEIQLQNDQGIIFNQFRHTITQDDVPSILFSYDTGSTTLDSEKLSDFLDASKVIEISEPENGTGDTRELTLDFKLEYAVDSNIEYDYEFKGIRVTGTREFDYSVTSNGNSNTGTLNLSDSGDQNITLSLTISDDDEYEGREELQLSIDGIGTIPIIIVDNDLPSLEITTSSGENVAPVSYDNININAIDIPEQDTYSATAEASVASHEFSLTLSGDAQALEDLAISFDQTDLFDTNDIFFVNGTSEIADAFSCDYLALENRKATLKGNESQGDDFDYRVLINNGSGEVELGEGTAYSFPKGENKLDLVIEVNDDIAVECLEFLSLTFSLSPAAQSNGLISESTFNFQIDNKDKAVLTVTGFTGEEGSSDVTPTPRNSNNQFQLGLSQPINTKVTYSLAPSDDYSCNNDDIDNLTGSSELTFTDVVQANYITVDIPQDNLVEPDEVCQLAVTNYDGSIVDVSNGLTAQGTIENDDFLTVTLTTSDTAEPEADNATASIGTYSWDKDIAANVGPITLLATKENCADGVDCIEDEDTSFGSDETQSIHIHNGTNSQQTNSNTDTPAELPIDIIGDSVVENIETLSFDITVLNGAEYLEPVSKNEIETNYLIDISSTDTLAVFLSQESSDCNDPDNHEIACTLIYSIEFDSDISDQIEDLNVSLKVLGDNSLNIKSSSTDENYVDAIISVRETGSGPYVEKYPDANKETSIEILKNGEVQSPSIKVEIKSDDVVEVDEKLSLELIKGTNNDVYEIDSTKNTITQSVNNDDFLNITFTQSNSSELNAPPQLATKPFTYTWDRVIAPNVPTIQFVYEGVCGLNSASPPVNCAEANDSNLASINRLITVHENGGDTYTAVPDSPLSLNVSYALDERVEANEHLTIQINKAQNAIDLQSTNVDGRAYVSHLNGSTVSSIELNSIIQNDDYLALSVTNTTDTDDTCAGFSGESGCNIYSISWGSQIADSDAGDIIVPLSLPALASHTRFAANGTTNPKDYSVLLNKPGVEITYADDENNLNLGAGLAANESIPLIIDINNDNFVEPTETLTVSLNADGSPFVQTINSSDTEQEILSYTIPIDDLVTVSVFGSGTSANEAGDSNGVVTPFTYTTDNPVAANTPPISILSTPSCSSPCATSASDFTYTPTVSLHTDAYNPAMTEAGNWPVTIQPDTTVEQHEKVAIALSASTGADYLRFKHSAGVAATGLDLAYTINNVDELALAISETIDGDCGATGLTEETGCREFDISWTQEIEGLDNPSIDINTTGTTASSAETKQDINLVETVVDPKDYSLELESTDITDQSAFSLDINGASSHTLKVSLIDDDFVELSEQLSLYLSSNTNYVSVPTNSIFSAADKINHTIPASADQVTITVESAASSPEPSDTGGLASPFTYTTDKFITANVPAINLTVEEGVRNSNFAEPGAGNDYTLPSGTISIHTNGEYSSKILSGTDLGVAILDDNIIEAAENVNLSLSVDETSYALLAPNNPVYVISNVDLLDITIEELSGADTTCTGFNKETGCREYKLSWINELQSGSASLELKASGDNEAASIESRDTNDSSVITDPQDYYLEATNITGTDSNIDGTTITIEDTDGVAETKSMKVSINLNDDEFVEPKEQLSVYFSAPTEVNSIGIISNFTDALNPIEYEIPIDDTLTITFTGSGTSGREPHYDVNGLVDGTVEKPFTYTTNAPIAANTPTIALNLSKSTCDTSPCATLGTGNDFTVGSTTDIHVGSTAEVSGVYKPIDTKSLDVTILDDQIVEVDESIKVRATESSPYIESIGNTDMTFTINSNDKTTLSISSLTCTGDATTVEELDANDKCVFTLNNSLEVDRYVPNLYVDLNFISGLGYATLDSDYKVGGDESGSTGLFKIKSYNSKLDVTGIEVDIDIESDNLIEFNEVIQPTLATTTENGSNIYTTVSENETHKIVIQNDDKINVSLPNITISEEAEPTIDAAWVYGDESEFSLALADTASDFIFSVTQGDTGSTTITSDYKLANKTLSLSNGDTATSGVLASMAEIINDKVIEKDESLNLTLSVALESTLADSLPSTASATDVINITTASKSYTILDGDDLSVEAAKYINEGNDSVNNKSYSINICKPANDYSIENYSGKAESIALDFNVNATPPVDNTNYSKTYSNAICGNDPQIHDYACANAQSKTLALSSFDESECVVIPALYTVYSDEIPEANKHIQHKLTVAGSEVRISGFDMQQLTIVNDDFNPITDTGLKHCVKGAANNEREIVDCDDSNTFHLKQDTLATADSTTYTSLAYTQVDEKGDPAYTTYTADTYTYSNSECFQDNHTGIWWTGTISDPSDSNNKFTQSDDYTVFLPDTICGQNKTNWQLPTVQDLMSVTIIKHAFAESMTTPKSTHRETSAYQAAMTHTVTFDDGTTTITYDKFYESAYWTSDACSSDGVTGYWTVDFFTAELACEDPANTNFKTLVYKPQ